MRRIALASLAAATVAAILTFPGASPASAAVPAQELPGTASPTTECYDTVNVSVPVYEQVLVGWTPAGAAPPPYQLPPTTTYVQENYTERVAEQQTRQVAYTEQVQKTRQVAYTEQVQKTRKVTYTEKVKKFKTETVCKDVKKTGTKAVTKEVEEKYYDIVYKNKCTYKDSTGKTTCTLVEAGYEVKTRRYTVTEYKEYTYWETECKSKEVAYWDEVERTKTETYMDTVTKYRTETYMEPVTKYRTEVFTVYRDVPRTRLVPVTTPGAWVYPPPTSAPQPIYENQIVRYDTVTRYLPAVCPDQPLDPTPTPTPTPALPPDPDPTGTVTPPPSGLRPA